MADIDSSVTSKAFLDADVSSRILGRPPWFTYETDPSGRVFTRCLAHNAPILVITPGIPDFSAPKKDEADRLKNDLLKVQDISNKIEKNAATAEEVTAYEADLNKSLEVLMTNMKDNRYYKFKPTPKEYLYILNSMMVRMNSRLSTESFIPKAVNIGTEDASWYGINMYCTKKSTISESASNSYGESMLESVQKGVSDKLREIWFVKDGATNTSGNEETGTIAAGRENVMDNAMGGLMKGAAATINGEKLMLPKIWKDSSFDKSYNLDFEFQSIYGDIASIFEHVFKPYLAILALALPRQTALASYKNPFLVRIESPGWFNIECGVIESITINRAPEESDWSKDGLCKKIQVSMQVRDIYPSLMLSYSTSALSSNIGMAEYLDSLAGITIQSQTLVNIKRVISDSIGGTLGAVDAYLEAKQAGAREFLQRASLGLIK